MKAVLDQGLLRSVSMIGNKLWAQYSSRLTLSHRGTQRSKFFCAKTYIALKADSVSRRRRA